MYIYIYRITYIHILALRVKIQGAGFGVQDSKGSTSMRSVLKVDSGYRACVEIDSTS